MRVEARFPNIIPFPTSIPEYIVVQVFILINFTPADANGAVMPDEFTRA